ncbi:MAG: 2-oxo-4-hydroxy-4-carboxy-5-ureidoimidazoline decarboxylase [bacterium]
MNLDQLNQTDEETFVQSISQCCGSRAWVQKMLAARPFASFDELLKQSTLIWNSLEEKDWLEAFTHHPKIGDIDSLRQKFASTAHLAGKEQQCASAASDDILQALKQGNEQYEQKFGFIFIVCATGKTAEQMLSMLQQRILNSPQKELKIAVGEQNKITAIRLKKLID